MKQPTQKRSSGASSGVAADLAPASPSPAAPSQSRGRADGSGARASAHEYSPASKQGGASAPSPLETAPAADVPAGQGQRPTDGSFAGKGEKVAAREGTAATEGKGTNSDMRSSDAGTERTDEPPHGRSRAGTSTGAGTGTGAEERAGRVDAPSTSFESLQASDNAIKPDASSPKPRPKARATTPPPSQLAPAPRRPPSPLLSPASKRAAGLRALLRAPVGEGDKGGQSGIEQGGGETVGFKPQGRG